MIDDSEAYKRLTFAACAALAIGGSACSSDHADNSLFATRVSRSSTIALAEDTAHLAMVNPDDGSLSVFATADNSRTAKVATGGNPSSVVIAPDSKTAYVANRADGTVVRVTGIDGGTPAIDATVTVGATLSILDLADQLLHRLRDCLAGMSDVYLPHGRNLNVQPAAVRSQASTVGRNPESEPLSQSRSPRASAVLAFFASGRCGRHQIAHWPRLRSQLRTVEGGDGRRNIEPAGSFRGHRRP